MPSGARFGRQRDARPVVRPSMPNVLYIVWDDAAMAAWNAFGGLIDTPSMRWLAARGLRYSRWHTTALSSSTRSSLLTGRDCDADAAGRGGPGEPDKIMPSEAAAACCSFTDHQIGRLLGCLEESGLLQDTIVVACSAGAAEAGQRGEADFLAGWAWKADAAGDVADFDHLTAGWARASYPEKVAELAAMWRANAIKPGRQRGPAVGRRRPAQRAGGSPVAG